MAIRKIEFVIRSMETLEGAGVKVKRAFGDPEVAYLTDPFLLLDDFGSRYPHEYLAGFPWHPHRGFETVTYVIKGEVHHEDSTGAKGVIRSGDIQWMTAGSGIFHSEMPRPMKRREGDREVEDPEHRGLQLWVNLPSRLKMTTPLYRNLREKNVPHAELDSGVLVRLIAGRINRVPGVGVLEGPVSNVSVSEIDVGYMEALIPPNTVFTHSFTEGYTVLAYVVEGSFYSVKGDREVRVGRNSTAIFTREGKEVVIRTGEESARILLLSGRPIGEPIAWYGPIVMSYEDEILQALRELREGTFVKHKATEIDDVE